MKQAQSVNYAAIFYLVFMFILIILLPAVMSAHLSHLWTAIERQPNRKYDYTRTTTSKIRHRDSDRRSCYHLYGQRTRASFCLILFLFFCSLDVVQYLIHLNSRQNRLVWRDFLWFLPLFFCASATETC